MQSQSLTQVAEEALTTARASGNGRAAHTVHGGHEHDLRQTLIALTAGNVLGEHEAPREATLQVLTGTVRLSTGDDTWTGSVGDYLVIPAQRHDLHAVTDAVVLLTVATRA